MNRKLLWLGPSLLLAGIFLAAFAADRDPDREIANHLIAEALKFPGLPPSSARWNGA